MFLDIGFGPLSAPLAGQHWDEATVRRRYAQRLSFLARQGVSRGDRVFLHHGNTLEFFVDLVAIWSLGGCAVPVDARLTPFEVETLAKAARPRLSLWPGTPDATLCGALAAHGTAAIDATEADAEALPVSLPSVTLGGLDDDALILFTSGTTGQPKGVVHTHRSLRARWMMLRQALGLAPFRRTLCLLPTHFGHGLICNSLFPWLAGQHLHVTPPFRPDILLELGALIDAHAISFLSSVPAIWRLAIKTAAPPRTGALERVFCGSAPLSAHLWEDVRRWTGTRQVWNAYGITETGSWLAGTSVPDFEPEDGLVGEAWGGVVRVLKTADAGRLPGPESVCAPGENGHVWVNTPALMRGYFERDDLTSAVVAGGWFCTGDIGAIDERGWLYLRGREREEINKGGMKIYPADVDSVAERFPATLDVCTFAIEDTLLGEDVGVAVVLRENDPATLVSLREWMGTQLARHQMPKRWWVVDEIPRTSRGKVNRAAVANRCAGLPPAATGASAGRP